MAEIKKIKKEQIPYELLNLADSDKDHINIYIRESVFFALFIESEMVGIIGLKELNTEEIEIICVAVYKQWENQGFGKQLVDKAIAYSKQGKYKKIVIKTGNSGLKQLKIYMKCGFRMEKILSDHFLHNYRYPIYENDIQCVDQIQLKYKIYSEAELEILTEKYWNRFIVNHPEYENSKYEVWSFGYGDYQANKLLGYVKQGIKTGTSSAFDLYDETEKRPEKNDLSIVTYGNGIPGCIIKTTEIRNKIFSEINEEEARAEGEGKLTLDYWREVHEFFFRKEYDDMGRDFSYNIPIIYEKFEVIFDDYVKL